MKPAAGAIRHCSNGTVDKSYPSTAISRFHKGEGGGGWLRRRRRCRDSCRFGVIGTMSSSAPASAQHHHHPTPMTHYPLPDPVGTFILNCSRRCSSSCAGKPHMATYDRRPGQQQRPFGDKAFVLEHQMSHAVPRQTCQVWILLTMCFQGLVKNVRYQNPCPNWLITSQREPVLAIVSMLPIYLDSGLGPLHCNTVTDRVLNSCVVEECEADRNHGMLALTFRQRGRTQSP